MKIFAVVVTYNRKNLLENCLQAISKQDLPLDGVLIVDNASTDGTYEWLAPWVAENIPQAQILRLGENTGGAGGFSAGIGEAIRCGADWVWVMDDDAEPRFDALAALMRVANDSRQIYGSLAVCGEYTSWVTTVVHPALGEIEVASAVPACATVQSLPFLGFLIHKELVAEIGLPDAEFFIAADDIEYCVRAQKSGAKIIISGESRIEHPKTRPYKIGILGHTMVCLDLPPWKRYYDTRNRLLIARKYYGYRLWTQAVPGTLVRMVVSMLRQPGKLAQARAFWAGAFDGLLGIKGKRHEKWGIKP